MMYNASIHHLILQWINKSSLTELCFLSVYIDRFTTYIYICAFVTQCYGTTEFIGFIRLLYFWLETMLFKRTVFKIWVLLEVTSFHRFKINTFSVWKNIFLFNSSDHLLFCRNKRHLQSWFQSKVFTEYQTSRRLTSPISWRGLKKNGKR